MCWGGGGVLFCDLVPSTLLLFFCHLKEKNELTIVGLFCVRVATCGCLLMHILFLAMPAVGLSGL